MRRSSRTAAAPKAHAAFESSKHCADCTMGNICAPMLRKRLSLCCFAVAKAQAVITKQRKLNCSTFAGMCCAAASNRGVAKAQIAWSVASNLAKAQSAADSSKGLKLATCRQDNLAAICNNSTSGHCNVANDHVMLLNAWHWGGAPPASDFANATRADKRRPCNAGCTIKHCCTCGLLEVNLAKRCIAVDTFTKFMSGKNSSMVVMSMFKSPVSATAII
mmetsp:Transcript_52713/g.151962  ORF Transcript_52713/g.151962 Transcript_52713/m.151962 type:complete len:219 (-) Transcript_52713:157-813(-)